MNLPVQTQGPSKRYGGQTAVRDLDLTVRAGEVYGFLGPNGAGKTTTLRMLLGLVRPSAGTVRLLGRTPGAGRLTGVGALIEGPAFYPYLSGRDNLRVLARYAADPAARRGRLHGPGLQSPARRGRADLRPDRRDRRARPRKGAGAGRPGRSGGAGGGLP
ncbi:ATP-binding cassette domain-containing protein [Micromonospora sp. NPDC005599]|uniref:ATP-binding cassette domain-containing protein n=1 Tax=unclassified Micromonospora TaxID=2617518 RepID=UPI0033A00A7D